MTDSNPLFTASTPGPPSIFGSATDGLFGVKQTNTSLFGDVQSTSGTTDSIFGVKQTSLFGDVQNTSGTSNSLFGGSTTGTSLFGSAHSHSIPGTQQQATDGLQQQQQQQQGGLGTTGTFSKIPLT